MNAKCQKCGKVFYHSKPKALHCRGCSGEDDDIRDDMEATRYLETGASFAELMADVLASVESIAPDVSYDSGSGGDSFSGGDGSFGGAGASGDF